MTKKKYIYLFDTSLRDGAQTPNIDYSLADKINIAKILDEMEVDYIEGGYPGANPTDTEFFQKKQTKNAIFTAFGMTNRSGVSIQNDPNINALIQANAKAICFVAKSSEEHVKIALEISNQENIKNIKESINAAVKAKKETLVDMEHFFDGFKHNKKYSMECVNAAIDAGAQWIVLCDTNGGTQPDEIKKIVREVCKETENTKAKIGIHAHNDTGQAVANSLAAIEAGATQIQGTINGIGERCGNANLITIIANLKLKKYYNTKFEIKIKHEKIKELTQISRAFDEIINKAPIDNAPYVGSSAFATKAGIHASALIKNPKTYEHVKPEDIGNERNLMISDQGGKANFINQLKRLGFNIKKTDPKLDKLINEVKLKEANGYAFEAAQASFALMAQNILEKEKKFFKVESFKVDVERRFNAIGDMITVSQAIVKINVDGQMIISVAEGNGPVNALDNAMRTNLGKYQNKIKNIELIDYKVRILNGGTTAITRVLIESIDETGERWSTIGVSENIIDASFQALEDSLNYKLIKEEMKNK